MANPNTTLIDNQESLDITSHLKENLEIEYENPTTINQNTQEKPKSELHLQYSLKLKNYSYDSREPRSMAVESSFQRFYNPTFQMRYEEGLYTDDGDLNKDFKENLKFFHTVYSLLTILKFACNMAGFIFYSTTVKYFSINLVIILLLFCTQGVIFYYILKVCSAKEKVYYFYGSLIFFTIIYFGVTNSKAFEFLTGIRELGKIEPDCNLYILVLVVISKDLFYNNPLMTFVQSLAGILISLLMYIIEQDSDNYNSLISLILLCIGSIYLVVYSYRIDFKQKHFFTEFDTQRQMAEKIQNTKTEGLSESFTKRELVLAKCNKVKSIFEQISPLMVCKILGKELVEVSKEIDQIKEFLIELPIIATNEVSIMLRSAESCFTRQVTLDFDNEISAKNLRKAFTMSSWPSRFQENFINNWDFDVLVLKEPNLFCLSSQIALDSVIEKDKISWLNREHYFEFMRRLEKEYLDTTYHSSLHAVDVLHSMLHLIFSCNLNNKLEPLDWITCIVAALGHDAGHPGRDNLYLRETEDELTVIYNDHMILENMHCAKIFNLFKQTGCNFASKIGKNDWRNFRENLIDMILGTNFSTYQETAGKLKCLITEKMGNECFRVNDKPFILPIILKCADVGHFGKEPRLYEKWSLLLLNEYMDLPEDNFSDLILKNDLEFHRNNAKFLKYIVLPLYQAFESYISLQNKSIKQILKNLNKNKSLMFVADTPVQSTTDNAIMMSTARQAFV